MQPVMTDELPPKQWVVSAGVSQTSYREVVSLCARWIAAGRHIYPAPPARLICVTSVHGLITAYDDPDFARILKAADLVTPDGMPVVWALRSFGIRGQTRVYGPTLMLELCRSAAAHGHRIFFYGSRPETLAALTERLTARYPCLSIAGSYAPPFRPLTEAESAHVCALIRASQADLVFIGLSTPKQERWMAAHRHALPGTVLIGVGAAFDFHAGRIRQAPAWMQAHGLEWLFRLSTEPTRLWRRYLLLTPRFLPLWLGQLLRRQTRRSP